MRKPLIINMDEVEELRRDGPALLLRARGRSRQWFPFRRLSRILITGVPENALHTLLACCGQGVPVTILNRRGQILGQIIHPGRLPHPLGHWMDALEAEPELDAVYKDWLENQQRRAYGLIGCFGYNSAHSAQKAQQQLQKLASKKQLHDTLPNIRTWLESLLATHMQCLASNYGLPGNSRYLQKLKQDLMPPALALATTSLVHKLPAGKNTHSTAQLARFYQAHCAQPVEDWLQKAFTALCSLLEECALGQQAIPPKSPCGATTT
ncbi:CRISPR associated protein Cas1 [Microbulbifer thermotolerans]|uniref:CRISPR-associated endonuclease Cas1 n=1 Tax=Microbulbifer thermotolerans TaxID=252514 RepID=UPI0008EB540E|nr:CRISPR-associated endonuclease Cas1 [Microbulbifer thermotolerans]SFD09723.1 CRISPR associated protein Cas1 [Microbulbifer thermotolerans]